MTAIADATQLARQQIHRILAAAVEDESVDRGPKIYEPIQQNAGHYLVITGPSDRVSGRFRVADGDAREGDFILEQTGWSS